MRISRYLRKPTPQRYRRCGRSPAAYADSGKRSDTVPKPGSLGFRRQKTLTFQGRQYPLSIGGVSAACIGASVHVSSEQSVGSVAHQT